MLQNVCATSPSSGNPFFNDRTSHLTQYLADLLCIFSLINCSSNDQSKVLSFLVLKSYHWFLNPCVVSNIDIRRGLHRSITIVDVILYAVLCIHHMHWWLHQLWCTLNKDSESVDDDWRKYPIILSDAVLQSLSSFLIFWRPCFCNLGKPQCGMVTCDSVINTWRREPLAIMHRSYAQTF